MQRHDDLEPAAIGKLPRATATACTLPHGIATFTGRHRELTWLLDAITGATTSVGIIAIDGMPGVGKTALAVHTAHLLTGHFPDGQLYLDLHGHTAGQEPVNPGDALNALLCFSGVEPTAVPARVDERAAMWRSRLAGRRVLVVLDDAASHRQVTPLLPGVPGSCVVITARRRMTALDGAVTMPLDVLPPDDAADLFVRIVGTGDPRAVDVRELTAQVGYLPLAIRLLAGWLRAHPSWSVGDLVGALAEAKDRSAAVRAENVVVGAAFDMSFDALRQRSKAFFTCLGLHPGVDLDAPVAAALADVDEDEAAHVLDELYHDHLIEEPVRARYRFHDLIRDYVRGLAADLPAAAADDAMTRLLAHYSSAVENGTSAWVDAALPDLLATIEHTADRHASAAARLSHALYDHLYRHGHWDQAVGLYRTARRAARAAGDRAAESAVLRDLAVFHRLRGDYAVAAAYLGEALALHDGLDDPSGKADVLGKLGVVHRLIGSATTALDFARRALAIRREIGNQDGVATSLSEIGMLQVRLGDYATARETARTALEICRATGDRARESTLLRTLGVVELKLGLLDEAEATFTQALHLARETGYRIAEADAMHYLADVHRQRGRVDDAHTTLVAALDIFTTIGSRRGQTEVMNDLGTLLHDRDPVAARRMHVIALRSARAITSARHQAHAWEGIGRSLVASGDVDRGLARLRRALDLYRGIDDHEGVAVEELITRLATP